MRESLRNCYPIASAQIDQFCLRILQAHILHQKLDNTTYDKYVLLLFVMDMMSSFEPYV